MRLTEVELFYQELLPTLRKPDVWERMMKQISSFWRFGSFSEAMLLTEQNPKATAVATYEQWNKMGRYVKKGSLSTIVFTGINDTSPKYLFDISQTYGRPILPKWEDERAVCLRHYIQIQRRKWCKCHKPFRIHSEKY